jgi:3-hydroxyisobutyrate dehydrogenase-like beta-hydroxyacid dehydrogenase
MAVIAIIGFGELGSCLAEGLARTDDNVVRGYAPRRSQPAAAASLADRLRRAGASRCESLEALLTGAGMVLSAVPPSASRETAERCAPLLEPGSHYVDLTAAPVADKEAAAALVEQAGALYVDAAVLGTVATSGFEVPIVVSGAGADGWRALVVPEGLNVEVIDGPAGHATLLKLLRSVYMKGRDALIVEMMLAARRYGLDERVAASIAGPGETVPFAALAERVLCAVAVHAERRSDELLASSEVLTAVGVDPVLTRAGSQVLRGLADLGLRDSFDRERPSNSVAVLERIDELSSRPAVDER